MAGIYHPDPERDRRLARKPRLGWRKASSVGDQIDRWTRSPEHRQLLRMRKVRLALVEILGEQMAEAVVPVSLQRQVLTLEVADGMLLAELRNHIHHELLDALACAGAAVTRIVYRPRKNDGSG